MLAGIPIIHCRKDLRIALFVTCPQPIVQHFGGLGNIRAVSNVQRWKQRWINLFGALRNAPKHVVEEHYFGTADIDEIVTRVESFVVDEYQRGGVTKQARDRLNEAIERIRSRGGPTPPP